VLQDNGEPLSVDGARGRWSMPWVSPGEYRVFFMSSSGGAALDASVKSGADTELEVQLDPALAGQAVLSAVKPRQ
jgi:hypothetical protein